jgi:AcrR family transcriptional regulator
MSPPRARALNDEGGARDLRTHLIAVTESLLAEQGLEGLTTRRIARAANVADGVLYNHFANKSDLIFAGLVARTSTRGVQKLCRRQRVRAAISSTRVGRALRVERGWGRPRLAFARLAFDRVDLTS